jgi:hypothetical protein
MLYREKQTKTRDPYTPKTKQDAQAIESDLDQAVVACFPSHFVAFDALV